MKNVILGILASMMMAKSAYALPLETPIISCVDKDHLVFVTDYVFYRGTGRISVMYQPTRDGLYYSGMLNCFPAHGYIAACSGQLTDSDGNLELYASIYVEPADPTGKKPGTLILEKGPMNQIIGNFALSCN